MVVIVIAVEVEIVEEVEQKEKEDIKDRKKGYILVYIFLIILTDYYLTRRQIFRSIRLK